MASAALDAFNARVDASSLSAAAKNVAKDWGERLYVAAIKEAVRHVRHHAQAVIDDPDATTQEKNRAQQVLSVTQAIIDRADDSPWWLEAAS